MVIEGDENQELHRNQNQNQDDGNAGDATILSSAHNRYQEAIRIHTCALLKLLCWKKTNPPKAGGYGSDITDDGFSCL